VIVLRSPTYRQLSRHKKLLTEDMPSTEKSFVISKAATAGQITLSTAVFGRGTDFFCKDEAVQSNGGVHIIQVRLHIFLFLRVFTSYSYHLTQ
jgi:preprotein translocase subunit SecA